ncbi:AraC family transcriptional regulator [Tenacibaculum skagerrakense]|uniref:AraC family transcriptional regulator n=1 Tax=Tenacibaculum skagerrakense TaxID=186571 RepID=A0A4R2P3G4_9FLAO|nr:AraC family transcriptional regulator [Tenacibaculum skagerrakense]TCP28441.1 AraC family transcriptional regulator [Tenacibaculum skagerrakense]
MKVLPFKIPKPKNLGVIYQEDKTPIFYGNFHEHEEIQISCIIKGKGTLVVGDTIHQYSENDVFVIGSNLPHVFKSDGNEEKADSFMISLFFTETSFGTGFFKLDDFKELDYFFKKSSNGCKLINSQPLVPLFLQLQKASNLERFITFLELLKILNKSESIPLASFIAQKKHSDDSGKRMQTIMRYTMDNFNSEITLDTIAEKANMTKNAFCRYFKKRTNKSYFTFLNELRIENACKLLTTNNEISIKEIAYKCGYNSLSNFNRKFLAIKKTTPLKYRNAMLQRL